MLANCFVQLRTLPVEFMHLIYNIKVYLRFKTQAPFVNSIPEFLSLIKSIKNNNFLYATINIIIKTHSIL